MFVDEALNVRANMIMQRMCAAESSLSSTEVDTRALKMAKQETSEVDTRAIVYKTQIDEARRELSELERENILSPRFSMLTEIKRTGLREVVCRNLINPQNPQYFHFESGSLRFPVINGKDDRAQLAEILESTIPPYCYIDKFTGKVGVCFVDGVPSGRLIIEPKIKET